MMDRRENDEKSIDFSDEGDEYATPPEELVGEAAADVWRDEQAAEKVMEDIARALALKEQGNALYLSGDCDAALETYSDALKYVSQDDSEHKPILLANRAACYMSLRNYDEVVTECTLALKLKPDYEKALLRRAWAFEKLEKYTDALEDWKKMPEYLRRKHSKDVRRVELRANEQMERQKDEMLGQLKEMGNSLLGKFGLSLDNFQAQKDPQTGSYSINFKQ